MLADRSEVTSYDQARADGVEALFERLVEPPWAPDWPPWPPTAGSIYRRSQIGPFAIPFP
jgi:hypothetical protein